MIHRHVVYPAGTPPERLPSAALADILDRGDLDAWRPIAAAIARDPLGPLAEKVMVLLDSFPMYGTSPLWRAWIDRCRARADSGAQAAPPLGLAALRRRFGLTQIDVAKRVGMSQSDLSKLERRTDVRLSTLQAYAEALGGRIAAVFTAGTGRIEVLPGSARVDRHAPRRRPRRRGAAR